MADHDVFLADCPARTTLSLIANTWTAVVLVALGERPMRFSQLQVRIGGISKKMLAQTLRRLQDNGLILHRPVRPRDYELTPLGRTLLEPIQELVQWAETHTDELLSAAGRDSQATA